MSPSTVKKLCKACRRDLPLERYPMVAGRYGGKLYGSKCQECVTAKEKKAEVVVAKMGDATYQDELATFSLWCAERQIEFRRAMIQATKDYMEKPGSSTTFVRAIKREMPF